MESSPPSGGSRLVAVTAVLAGLLGIGALVLGFIGLIERVPDDSGTATTVAATTTTSRPGTTTAAPPATGTPSAGLVTITDDTGSLSVSVPAEWVEVAGGPWVVDGEEVGLSLFASVDRVEWYEGWGAPGAFIGVTTVGSDVYTPDLGDFSGACDYGAVDSPEIGGFVTLVQEWVDCGPERSRFHVALLWPESFAYTALVQVVTLEGGDPAVLDTILDTFSHQL